MIRDEGLLLCEASQNHGLALLQSFKRPLIIFLINPSHTFRNRHCLLLWAWTKMALIQICEQLTVYSFASRMTCSRRMSSWTQQGKQREACHIIRKNPLKVVITMKFFNYLLYIILGRGILRRGLLCQKGLLKPKKAACSWMIHGPMTLISYMYKLLRQKCWQQRE